MRIAIPEGVLASGHGATLETGSDADGRSIADATTEILGTLTGSCGEVRAEWSKLPPNEERKSKRSETL